MKYCRLSVLTVLMMPQNTDVGKIIINNIKIEILLIDLGLKNNLNMNFKYIKVKKIIYLYYS